MTIRLDGRSLAEDLEKRLQVEISDGLEFSMRPPGLAVIRIGDDPASGVYVANKERACHRIGLSSSVFHLPADITQERVLQKIKELNSDEKVDGILLQLPLPRGMDPTPLLLAIDPDKDSDGLHTLNLGRLLKGEKGPRSCTPAGVMALLAHNQIDLKGKRAVVIGRSILVGKPMALMLQNANATVTVAHSCTEDIEGLTKNAEILIVAAGQPRLIGTQHVHKDSVVVDVGIHRVSQLSNSVEKSSSKLCGDVNYEEVSQIVKAITPVPGGVGPMTVAMLLVNTVSRWQQHCGLSLTLEDLLP